MQFPINASGVAADGDIQNQLNHQQTNIENETSMDHTFDHTCAYVLCNHYFAIYMWHIIFVALHEIHNVSLLN